MLQISELYRTYDSGLFQYLAGSILKKHLATGLTNKIRKIQNIQAKQKIECFKILEQR